MNTALCHTKRHNALLLLVLLGTVIMAFSPSSFANSPHAGTQIIQQAPLSLNGIGKSKPFSRNRFEAKLYLPNPSSDALDILHHTSHSKLELRFTGPNPISEKFLEKWLDQVYLTNSPELCKALHGELKALKHLFQNAVIETNDKVTVEQFATGKTRVAVGEFWQKEFSHPKLMHALLNSFIGDKATNPSLKAGLLGQKS